MTDSHFFALEGAAEPVQAVFPDEPASLPGAVADEVDSAPDFLDGRLGQPEPEAALQEGDDPLAVFAALVEGEAEQDEVVDVPDVVPDTEHSLDELVERIEVDQGVELAQQVADGDTGRLVLVGEQHHDVKEPPVFYLPLDEGPEDVAVYRVEEFPDVQLEGVAVVVISAQDMLGVVAGPVGAVALAAGEGGGDESPVENLVNHPVDGVLHHDVAERRGVDDAFLGFMDEKLVVRPGPVGTGVDLPV